jgi:replicative DNA helicase
MQMQNKKNIVGTPAAATAKVPGSALAQNAYCSLHTFADSAPGQHISNHLISLSQVHNAEAEQAVLGAILLRPSLLSKINKILAPGDFFFKHNKIVYSKMLEMYQSNIPIDLVSIADVLTKEKLLSKLPGQNLYLVKLTDTIAAPSHAEHHANIVRQLSLQRQILQISKRISYACGNPVVDLNSLHSILDETQEQINNIRNTITISDVENEKLDLQEIFTDENPIKIKEVIPGIIQGTINALIAPGGTGKSFFALELGAGLATGGLVNLMELPLFNQKFKVAYISLEDLVHVVQIRLKALRSRIHPQYWQDIYDNYSIYSLTGKNATILDLQREKNYKWINKYYKIAEQHDLMIIDTLRRIHRAKENDDAEMAEVLGILEEIAESSDCAIMFTHHVNKDSMRNKYGGEQFAARGSSVLTDNVRGQINLYGLSDSDISELKLDEEDKWRYVRVVASKMNNIGQDWYHDIILRRDDKGILFRFHPKKEDHNEL